MNKAKPLVNIVSCVKHDSSYIKAYFSQIQNLSKNNYCLGGVNLVCDFISNELKNYAACNPEVNLIVESLSDKGASTLEDKASQWAQIGNQGIEYSLDNDPSYLLWLESDLCIPSDLIDQLVNCRVDVVAPIVFLGGSFYDSWGFRDLNGARIQSVEQLKSDTNLVPLSSVGSCVLFRSEIFYQGIRFRGSYDDGLLVGICNDARRLGYKIWCDKTTSIVHPTSLWRQQVWGIVEVEIMEKNGGGRNIRLLNSYVAAAYDKFILDWINSNPSLVEILRSRSFDVRISRDEIRRELKLSFFMH